MKDKCPQCGSEKTIRGRVFNQPDYVAPEAFFRPRDLKPFCLFGINVRIKKNDFCGCGECGCVWSEIDPEQLEKIIKSKGNIAAKKRLGLKGE